MSFLKTFITAIEHIPGEVASFFSHHTTQIHDAIAEAQSAASAAAAIAATLGAASAASRIASISDGLTRINTAAASAATQDTLNEQAATLITLVNGLVNSGDIGVKNPLVQKSLTNTISSVVAKTNTVIGALVTAATNAPSSPPPAQQTAAQQTGAGLPTAPTLTAA